MEFIKPLFAIDFSHDPGLLTVAKLVWLFILGVYVGQLVVRTFTAIKRSRDQRRKQKDLDNLSKLSESVASIGESVSVVKINLKDVLPFVDELLEQKEHIDPKQVLKLISEMDSRIFIPCKDEVYQDLTIPFDKEVYSKIARARFSKTFEDDEIISLTVNQSVAILICDKYVGKVESFENILEK